MKMTRILTPLAVAVSAMVGAQQASAGPSGYAPPAGPKPLYHAGTAVVRVGASFVDPDDDEGRLFHRDEFFFDDFDDRHLRYDLDDDTTWNFTAGFMPIDHFMIEVGYIGQSDHDLDVRFPGFIDDDFFFDDNRARLGDLERWSGTLMFNWFPVCPESWVQPYVGIGAHYTDFDNHNIRGDAEDFLLLFGDAAEPVDGRMRYEDDWGWAAQAGIDILFGRDSNWLVNAAVMYLDTEVKADLHYRIEDDDFFFDPIRAVRTDFDFDVWVWNLGIGYKF